MNAIYLFLQRFRRTSNEWMHDLLANSLNGVVPGSFRRSSSACSNAARSLWRLGMSPSRSIRVWPWYLWRRRKSRRGCMFSGSRKSLDERWRFRNSTPWPIDDGIVRRGNEALKGSKSTSSVHASWPCPTAFMYSWLMLLVLPLTRDSLSWRYSEVESFCTADPCVVSIRIYSHTPGLGRTARATQGSDTISSYHTVNLYKLRLLNCTSWN